MRTHISGLMRRPRMAWFFSLAFKLSSISAPMRLDCIKRIRQVSQFPHRASPKVAVIARFKSQNFLVRHIDARGIFALSRSRFHHYQVGLSILGALCADGMDLL
jgi:hypothetical protein